MFTYSLLVGITPLQIGLLRMLLNSCNVACPIAMNKFGILRSGLRPVNWQTCYLQGAVVAFLLIDIPSAAASILVIGVFLGHGGLRGFDLCVQIIVQEVLTNTWQRMLSLAHEGLSHPSNLCFKNFANFADLLRPLFLLSGPTQIPCFDKRCSSPNFSRAIRELCKEA